MRSTKMIQGARALAAALGGAQVFKRGSDGQWKAAGEGAVMRWRRVFNESLHFERNYAVRADDARRVLG